MSTPIWIIKDRADHSALKLLSNAIEVVWHEQLMLIYNNNRKEDAYLMESYETINISDSVVSIDDKDSQFILCIKDYIGPRQPDFEFTWLKPNNKLVKAGYIERISENNSALILRFLYRYLINNPKDYVWYSANKFLFDLNLIQKAASGEFQEEWYC